MEAKNENRLNMYLVLIQYVNTIAGGILTSMPGFPQFFADFTANVNLIRSKNENQSSNRIGYRLIKTAGKLDTVTYAIYVASCITAYAQSINDTVLIKQMKFTKSALLQKRDTAMADDVQFILSKTIELLVNLELFGIKQLQIDELTAKLNNFNTNIPLPRANINKRKMLTNEIKKVFTATDVILARMDSLVDIKINTDNEFYVSYYFARKIINNHGRKLAIRGVVTSALNNPIEGVNIAIPALGLVTKATAKGYYEFKNLPAGLHSLYFTRVDFEETKRLVGILSGQRVQLDVTMNDVKTSNKVA